jgi:AAA+ superfamily predicted ATPase
MTDLQPRTTAQAWAVFADALLHRAALVARIAFDRLPSPLAGLHIDDDDLLRAVADLPGRSFGDDAAVEAILARTSTSIAELRETFHRDPVLAELVRGARLSRDEAEVLAVLAAVELDPRRQRLVSFLNDDVTQRFLTPYSLSQLFMDGEAWTVLRPDGALRRSALVTVDGSQPWARTPVQLAPLVCWRLAGHPSDDPELPVGCERWDGGTPGVGPTPDGAESMVVVSGVDRVRRRQAVAERYGARRLLVTPVPATDAEWDALVRQATLDGDPVVLEPDQAGLGPAVRRHLGRSPHLRWAVSSEVEPPIEQLPPQRWVALRARPAQATLAEIEAVLGPDAVHHAGSLTTEQLAHAGAAMTAVQGDVAAAVRLLASGEIDRVARRTTPRHRWDDLVLREDKLALVREIAVRHQHRHRVFDEWGFVDKASAGVLALFAGESGTGKTLSAEIIAGELGQDLCTVDLSQLISKYIGETEKNLEAVFCAAESSPVVLFFDEADAVLGKRSEVASSHDRYANVEVAYLLQRIERHRGVVVLATNMAKNLDPAFLRRIHVFVDFPMPDESERLRIWQRCIPPAMPTDGLDLGRFAARFEMSGGSIRNAALTAAFLAADTGGPMTPRVLGEAVRRELHKSGRYLRDDEFREFSQVGAAGRAEGGQRHA